ncbi:MAG TPA: hypothetical protein VMV92_26915 [Streptosporangiaceae bacterium]|nr:hypothetical protein [Streptosporangiaceae bacterium]
MSREGRERAARVARLVLRLAFEFVSKSSSGVWFIPPPAAEMPTAEMPPAQAPAFDPQELDIWLEQVLGDPGLHD